MCSRVAPELISDDSFRLAALAFQQFAKELLGRATVASGLNEDVYKVAILINRTP